MQGAAQNVELYMAFAQRARTIPLLLLPSWANYTPLVRLSPWCLRSLALLISCCLCCLHTAWWLKVERCQFFSMWAWWLGCAGAGDSWFCRIPYFCFLGTLLKYKQKVMCVCKLRVWMDSLLAPGHSVEDQRNTWGTQWQVAYSPCSEGKMRILRDWVL